MQEQMGKGGLSSLLTGALAGEPPTPPAAKKKPKALPDGAGGSSKSKQG